MSHRVVEILDRNSGWSNFVGTCGKARKSNPCQPGGGFYANYWDTNRMLRAVALPMLGFALSGGLNLVKDARLQIMRQIGKYAKENWLRLRRDPGHAVRLSFETGCMLVFPGKQISEAMTGLNRLIDA